MRDQAHANARVLVRTADHLAANRIGVEPNSIFRWNGADVLNGRDHASDGASPTPEQVEVPRCPPPLSRPEAEQHRTFQDKFVRVRRDAKPIEQTFDRKLRQHKLQFDAARFRDIVKPRADRCGEIARDLTRGHYRLSRYG